MIFGAGFLLAFTGGLYALWNLRADRLTSSGAQRTARQALLTTWLMAILAWLAVIIGTYVIYPWYRATAPPHSTGALLAQYPKFLLISNPDTADWHEFGMEWKEHIAWFSPILATAVAFVATQYRRTLASDARIRNLLLTMLTLSFFCAGVAGLFGAMINKFAPTR